MNKAFWKGREGEKEGGGVEEEGRSNKFQERFRHVSLLEFSSTIYFFSNSRVYDWKCSLICKNWFLTKTLTWEVHNESCENE